MRIMTIGERTSHAAAATLREPCSARFLAGERAWRVRGRLPVAAGQDHRAVRRRRPDRRVTPAPSPRNCSKSLHQTFVMENRPGAGTTIGTDAVAKAAPDGYTLLMVSGTQTVNETLYSQQALSPDARPGADRAADRHRPGAGRASRRCRRIT